MSRRDLPMLDPVQALERLREGNRRFASSGAPRGPADAQSPFVAIVGCSDSRVAPEIVFGLGLGEAFVVRVAGNVIGETEAASVGFATASLGVRLVVVLGHLGCGAVAAALEEAAGLAPPGEAAGLAPPGSLRAPAAGGGRGGELAPVVQRILPVVVPLVQAAGEPRGVAAEAVRENARAQARELRRQLPPGALVVAAVYSIETGLVELLD